METNDRKYPEGHFLALWMGIGIALFSGLGIVISVADQNYAFLGMGPAIGVAFGLAIGQGMENKYRNQGKIRPLTEKEKRVRRNALFLGLAIFLLGVVVFSVMYFSA